jgi:signal transduction histidine kinase
MASMTGPLGSGTGDKGAGSCVSLAGVVRDVLEQLGELVGHRGVEVEVGRNVEDAFVPGPEEASRRILFQLLRNALEASPRGGLVRVTLHLRGEQAIVEVSDEGQGILPEHFSKIFQRGFTTKPGSPGLGLSEVEERLAELKGGISWESPLRTGAGARFIVTLPGVPPPK